MDADGNDLCQRTFNTEHFPSAFGADWSPDGSQIAFAQSLSNTNTEIYLVNPDCEQTSQITQITSNGINSMYPSWSPDGAAKIVFERGPAGSSKVWVMEDEDADGVWVQTLLTTTSSNINEVPRWSPDGTQIVFSSYQGNKYQIYVMNLDDGTVQNISNSSFSDFYPDWQPVPISVDIDIKPGSFPNSINPRSKGVIPVAILTTATFDATTVDPLSVKFGPAGATESHGRGHIEDVDGDGDQDLVLHFRTQDTGIQCGYTSASLTGNTFDGAEIQGSDLIRTVGCK